MSLLLSCFLYLLDLSVSSCCSCITLCALLLTACIVAEWDNANRVSETSGDDNDEEVSSKNELAEGSGRSVLPEPKGTEPKTQPIACKKVTYTLNFLDYLFSSNFRVNCSSQLSVLQRW